MLGPTARRECGLVAVNCKRQTRDEHRTGTANGSTGAGSGAAAAAAAAAATTATPTASSASSPAVPPPSALPPLASAAKIELVFAHSTASMVVGYMSVLEDGRTVFKAHVSRLPQESVGVSMCYQATSLAVTL